MNSLQLFHGLDFHHHGTFHQQIDAIPHKIECLVLVSQRQGFLTLDVEPSRE
jgi:hypothetical protein